MIHTGNEKLALLLVVAPLIAEITMLVGFFAALILLLFHFGLL
jgi:hypothetical protein